MTPEAQAALRRVMETYAKVTRFCLICNYVTRIIEPLASRCAKFRFKPLPHSAMIERLTYIAGSLFIMYLYVTSMMMVGSLEHEGVKLEEGAVEVMIDASGGDMRKAVTYLQSSHQLAGGQLITADVVLEISGRVRSDKLHTITIDSIELQVPNNVVESLWQVMGSNRFDALKSIVGDITAEGYPILALLTQLHEQAIARPSLTDVDKAFICEKIAQVLLIMTQSLPSYECFSG